MSQTTLFPVTETKDSTVPVHTAFWTKFSCFFPPNVGVVWLGLIGFLLYCLDWSENHDSLGTVEIKLEIQAELLLHPVYLALFLNSLVPAYVLHGKEYPVWPSSLCLVVRVQRLRKVTDTKRSFLLSACCSSGPQTPSASAYNKLERTNNEDTEQCLTLRFPRDPGWMHFDEEPGKTLYQGMEGTP